MQHLRPSDIFFTQRCVSNHFKKGTAHSGYSIGLTLDDLCTGRCTVSDIPTINVMWEHGKWWTADNRRLWVFRQYERLGGCTTIPVIRTYWIDPRKKSTMNGGESVEIRNNFPGGTWWTELSGSLSTANRTPMLFGIEDKLANLSLRNNQDLRDASSVTRIRSTSPCMSTDDELFGLLRSKTSLQPRSFAMGQASTGWTRDTTEQTGVLTLQPAPASTRLIRPEMNRISAAVSRPPSFSILEPEKVKFTKRQISLSMDGRFPSAPSSVYKLWMNLVDGAVIPEYIPPIDVYQMDGNYWVVSGNKRLWAFRQAANMLPGLLIQAQVHTGDQREFLRRVNENNQSYQSLEDVLSNGDDVDIVDVA
ncbi:uncharacterized protein LOC135469310 [Liolophura sinensis]|uniref:uncharacterized protein LOC135469310 n=1 Tax=Liolophura sinensis TaxID=3198878 RepID=UPI0031587996